ncbi:MAG: PIN domain-containing protein [Caldimonas sp.]
MDLKTLQGTLRRFAAELIQIADRAAITLEAAPGARTHVLIDWENVQPDENDVRALVPQATDIWLFHGPNQKNVTSHHASFGERATPIRIARTGKNALDFHLSFYMGYIASRQPDARFVAISNDKGYGPMLDHAKELGFAVQQVGFGAVKVPAKTPARKAAARKTATTPALPARKATVKKAVKKSAAKKIPAKKTATKKTAGNAVVQKAAAAAPPAAAAKAAAARKSFEQVLAILRKSPAASRPGKHARLVAHIASMIGVAAGAPEADAMLYRLIANGTVSVNDQGSVTYTF